MCYEEVACPRCASRHIVKNGITANDKQRYRCKDCGRQFITNYSYRGRLPAVRELIVPMTINGSGIRDISRVLRVSPTTVIDVIRAAACDVAEPSPPPCIADVELDEFWSFVGRKANQRWTWYAFDRQRKRVAAYVNGRRTDENCRARSAKLAATAVTAFHSDEWAAYAKTLPAEKHHIGKAGTRHIERRNLIFRTRVKRLQRRTICFSKSEVMHDAVVKLHIHHSNHQI
ncbi:MAG: IS1 family transposase [Pyrinomonadaceae bacterium]